MKISPTLIRYIAHKYFINFSLMLLGLLAVVYLFDTVELIRRGSKRPDVPLSLMLEMGLLKLPEVGQVVLPFAVLFSAMFTFWQLTRRYELVIMRAAGFSVWQFLAPVVTVAVFIGLFQVMIFNPLGALLLTKFEQLESKYLTRSENQIAFFKEGFWLRQNMEEGYVIMHAAKIRQPEWILKGVMALFFDPQDQFVQRLDASEAQLSQGRWVFQDAAVVGAGGESKLLSSFSIPTHLTIDDVEESFSSPHTMSFWRLSGYIKTLQDAGFDASRLRVHYHNLLSQPLLFAAMVLLAAAVSMRPPRSRGGTRLFVTGVFAGFVIFFMSSFLQALGSSHQIPVLLAAWSPAAISFLLGTSIMLTLEDG